MGQNLAIPLYVFGPETHMTAIVGMALGTRDIPTDTPAKESTTANFLLPGSVRLISYFYLQRAAHAFNLYTI